VRHRPKYVREPIIAQKPLSRFGFSAEFQPPGCLQERKNRLSPKQQTINTIDSNLQESRVGHRAFPSEVLSHEKEGHYTLFPVPIAQLEISRSDN
jgi:hypothetical protein